MISAFFSLFYTKIIKYAFVLISPVVKKSFVFIMRTQALIRPLCFILSYKVPAVFIDFYFFILYYGFAYYYVEMLK